MIRAAAALALIAGCSAPCRDGTVFLTLDYDPAAAAADTVDLIITVNGHATPAEKTRPPGRTVDTIELDFAGAYPRGASLTVSAQASAGGVVIGDGSAAAALTSACATLTVPIAGSIGGGDGAAADQSASADGAEVDQAVVQDLSAADLAPPPDLAELCSVDMLPIGCPASCSCPPGFLCCKKLGVCEKILGPNCN